MKNAEARDAITTLVVKSTHELARRPSLVLRGLQDISSGFQSDVIKCALDRAMELLDEGKFDEAIAICTSGLEANPQDECLLQVKAVCLAKQDKYVEGLPYLSRALEVNNTNPFCWSLAARFYHHLGNTEGELYCWNRIIALEPDYKEVWRGIGDCLFTLGRYQEAIEAFASELNLSPSDDYCQSRKEIATAALRKNENQVLTRIESTDLKVSLMVTVGDWWTEPSAKTQLATVTPPFKSFSFVCSIENISDREHLLGKELTVVRYSPNTGQRSWVADALILDSTTIPKKIGADSEWNPVTIEVTWLCSPEMSDADCVQEFLSDKYETLGYDDKFGTVLLFA